MRHVPMLAWPMLCLLAAAANAQAPPTDEPPAPASAADDEAKKKGADDGTTETTAGEAGTSPQLEPGADGEVPTYAETMVVTASRTEESLLDVPVATSVITPVQLETAPADSYADVLRTVPGVNVVQTSARDLNVVARGAASTLATSQLAMLDGRSIYQDFFGFVMWDLLPVSFDEVEQVEVLRGPGSAMWGANALSGVVNVRTKSPRQTPGGAVSLMGGEQGTRSAAARWAQAWKRASYRVSASWLEQDAWPRATSRPDGQPLPPEAAFANEGTRQPKLDLRFDWDPSEERTWSYRVGGSGTSGIMHSGIGPFSIDPETRMDYGEASFSGKSFDVKGYLNRIDGDAKNLLNGIDFAFKSDTWVGDLVWRHPTKGRQFWLVGGNVRLNRFDLSLAPGEDARNEAGAFAEDQIFFGEKGILSLGARVDWFDTVGTTVSPRISHVWKPREHQSIRFAYNRAFRAPSLINNFLNTVVPNLQVLDPALPPFVFVTFATGSKDLKPEIVDAFEIGWTAEAGRHVVTAAIYQNDTHDTIDFYPAVYYSPEDPPIGWPLPRARVPERTLPKEYTYRNVGAVRNRGLELSLNTTWRKGVYSVATYAYQAEQVATEDDPVEPLNLNQPPRHQGSATLMIMGRRWRGQVSASYTGKAYWTDVLDQRFYGWTDSFVLLNASAGWAGEHVGFQVGGTNLLGDDVQQHVFGDIIGRVLTAEVKVKF